MLRRHITENFKQKKVCIRSLGGLLPVVRHKDTICGSLVES